MKNIFRDFLLLTPFILSQQLVSLLLITLCDLCTHSQWTKVTFGYGGPASVLCRDSLGNIYVGTSNGYIYKSTNQGAVWLKVSNGLGRQPISAILSRNNSVLAATDGRGIVRSTNQGNSWVLSNNGLGEYSLYALTSDDSVVITGGNLVYKSTDNGLTWDTIGNGIAFHHGIKGLAIYGNYYFAPTSLGTSGNLYRSTNSGNSWAIMNNGLPSQYLNRIAANGNSVWGLTYNSSLYKTTNYGENWVSAVFFGGTSCLNSFQNFISVSSGNNFNISTNYGQTWNSYISVLNGANSSDVLINDSYLISATDLGIQKSENGGISWAFCNNGFDNITVNSLACIQGNVLIGTSRFGLYKSANNGINWYQVPSVQPFAIVTKLKQKGSILYGLISSRLSRSTDYGESWSLVPTPNSSPVSNYEIKNNTIFVYHLPSVYYSTNLGSDWIPAMTGLPVTITALYSFYIADTCCYASISSFTSNTGIYRFSYSTSSWQFVSNSGLSRRIVVFSENADKVYAGALDSGVFVSTNSGLNWVRKSNGLFNSEYVTGFVFSADTIYASTYYNGICKSTNGANSWSFINEGLDSSKRFFEITAGPGTLFAGGQYGLWKRSAFVNVTNEKKYIPNGYILGQNYPNPFNPVTNINFSLPKSSLVKMVVYDITGKQVAELVNGNYNAGTYKVDFDASNLASGAYFYKITAGGFTDIKKMMLVK